jgi:hypothetical protein
MSGNGPVPKPDPAGGIGLFLALVALAACPLVGAGVLLLARWLGR